MSGEFQPPDEEEPDRGSDDGAEGDSPDDGPILLPPGASCKGCHYSDVIRISGSIQSVRICRRFPPNAVFMPNVQGGVLSSQPSQVPDDYVCFEYDARELPALIPTGLG